MDILKTRDKKREQISKAENIRKKNLRRYMQIIVLKGSE